MKQGSANTVTYRKDYRSYPWRVDYLKLHFFIGEEGTIVRSEMALQRQPGEDADCALTLDGRDLETLSMRVDGEELPADHRRVTGEAMEIVGLPDQFVLTTEVRIHPQRNTALEGLYQSGAFLLTQCEAEGFRTITWFPDRPDVMTRFEVTVEADRIRYPVLLSNGNAVAQGQEADRHWVRWEDPFPKPSYLFALVAGDLAHVEDHFTTRSGREVTLRVYVEKENIDRCDHAMESLIKAMRWDEERFGLEYDLDIYNIVATNDFNMGAMENKSLNIFNSKYVLARPDTATDWDYQAIEAVIGHEYFHNWTGNRVTCRDWFQLTLKEGLTVFRDEEFSADMQSRAVKRIQDARDLRLRQYPEDAGPMAHPIRPDRYVEVNNFYTATVYQKGAAVIRLYHTLLGEDGFQKGMRLYFDRHDGEAVTCDDFRAAMADANGVDLEHFGLWYSQSGTPIVTIRTHHDADSGTYRIDLAQATPPTADQQDKQPQVIPFAVGLLDSEGHSLALQLEGESAPGDETRLLLLDQSRQSFTFTGLPECPVPSLLRDFSAPVKVEYDYAPEQLAVLIANDTDPFARWEAAQRLSQDCILAQVERRAAGEGFELSDNLVDAFHGLLRDLVADPALLAEAMKLPDEEYLGEQMAVVDVDGIHAARQFIRRGLAARLEDAFRVRYEAATVTGPYSKDPEAIAHRALRNVCLSYLAETGSGGELCRAQLADSDNMTDALAALGSLVRTADPSATKALAEFERQWKNDALVMDKWFAMQATQPGHGTVNRVRELMQHPAFSMNNPNKVRSLVGAFCMLNPTGFHAPDGSGYEFLADRVIELNGMNPQVAARMVSAFNRWKRFDPERQVLMRGALERIAAQTSLSPDVAEIVSNALK
jgi:aminopeptidase N